MGRESLIDFDSYIIHKDGTIWSKHWKREVKGSRASSDDYVMVHLKTKDGKRDYFTKGRVIWFYFNGEIPEDLQVNHMDENKENNALSNLNLLTPEGNCNWGTRNERMRETLSKVMSGENHPNWGKKRPEHSERMKGEGNPRFGVNCSEETKRKIGESNSKKVLQYSVDGKLLEEYKSAKEAADTMKCSPTNIAMACRGKIKTAKGYIWKYA